MICAVALLQTLFIQDLGKPEPHKNIQVHSEQLLKKKKKMLERLQIPHRAGLRSTMWERAVGVVWGHFITWSNLKQNYFFWIFLQWLCRYCNLLNIFTPSFFFNIASKVKYFLLLTVWARRKCLVLFHVFLGIAFRGHINCGVNLLPLNCSFCTTF